MLKPLREFGPPLMDAVQPMPFPAMQKILDDAFPDGTHNYWKSTFLKALSDEAIDVMVEHANRVRSPLSAVVIEYYGGAAGRTGDGRNRLRPRKAEYDIGIMAQWTDPAESDRHMAWARDMSDAMKPHSSGGYLLNFLSEEDPDTIRAAFGATTRGSSRSRTSTTRRISSASTRTYSRRLREKERSASVVADDELDIPQLQRRPGRQGMRQPRFDRSPSIDVPLVDPMSSICRVLSRPTLSRACTRETDGFSNATSHWPESRPIRTLCSRFASSSISRSKPNLRPVSSVPWKWKTPRTGTGRMGHGGGVFAGAHPVDVERKADVLGPMLAAVDIGVVAAQPGHVAHRAETAMPPGSASTWMRSARLTPSPKMS